MHLNDWPVTRILIASQFSGLVQDLNVFSKEWLQYFAPLDSHIWPIDWSLYDQMSSRQDPTNIDPSRFLRFFEPSTPTTVFANPQVLAERQRSENDVPLREPMPSRQRRVPMWRSKPRWG